MTTGKQTQRLSNKLVYIVRTRMWLWVVCRLTFVGSSGHYRHISMAFRITVSVTLPPYYDVNDQKEWLCGVYAIHL